MVPFGSMLLFLRSYMLWYNSLENGQMQTDIWVFIIKIPDSSYITRTIRYTSTSQPLNALNQIENKMRNLLEPWRFSWNDSKSPIITASCSHVLLTGRNWVGCIGRIIKLTHFPLIYRALLLESMLQPKYRASLPSQSTEQRVTSGFS